MSPHCAFCLNRPRLLLLLLSAVDRSIARFRSLGSDRSFPIARIQSVRCRSLSHSAGHGAAASTHRPVRCRAVATRAYPREPDLARLSPCGRSPYGLPLSRWPAALLMARRTCRSPTRSWPDADVAAPRAAAALQRVSIALGVARGIAALHAKGIAHRRIKASNVLLDDAPLSARRIPPDFPEMPQIPPNARVPRSRSQCCDSAP